MNKYPIPGKSSDVKGLDEAILHLDRLLENGCPGKPGKMDENSERTEQLNNLAASSNIRALTRSLESVENGEKKVDYLSAANQIGAIATLTTESADHLLAKLDELSKH